MPNSLPSRAPVGLLLGGLLSLVAAAGVITYSWLTAPPLQQFYFKKYLTTSARSGLGILANADKPAHYFVFRLGASADPLCTAQTYFMTRVPTNPTQPIGGCLLETTPRKFASWLRESIFNGETPGSLIGFPLRISLGLAVLLLTCGLFYDSKRKENARKGVQLRGPDLVSRWRFNRIVKGDGFPICLVTWRNPLELLQGQPGKCIRIKRKHENNHIITMADPGGGKTSLIFQILDEIERRGETAIVYDPHMQFVGRYYNEERGDLIFNPLDTRCPSWSPSDELDHSDYAMAEANALAMATSLFPGKPTDRNWFFTYCSQLIWKHCLVEHQPDAHQMAELMKHSDPLIDIVVQGTELEQMMAQNAQNQRAGVISHLTQIAYSLRQIPKKGPGRRHLVLRDWCKKRKGWIFVTNSQDTRDGLRPIQSLMLDWVIMCMLSQGERPDLPPVLAVFDEVQTLQKLLQLVSLVTEGRKSLRVLIAFQGRSQIKALYGEEAEVLLSSPFSKFLMRTAEPEAGRWLSDSVGEVELERVRETRPAHFGGRGSHTYMTEQRMDKLVIPSEFSGLDDLHGFLKYGNLVLKLKLPIMPRREVAPAFVPRVGIPLVKKPLPDLASIKEERRLAAAEKKKANEEDRKAKEALAVALTALVKTVQPAVPTAETEPPPPPFFTPLEE